MTRRVFIYVDYGGRKLYVSPEFNGDKTEYAQRGGALDSCDLTTAELFRLFEAKSLSDFQKACSEAQCCYHSFLDEPNVSKESLPVKEMEVSELPQIHADELIFILKGGVMLTAPSSWDGRLESLYNTVNTAASLAQSLIGLAYEQGPGTLEYRQEITIPREEYEIICGYLNAGADDAYQDEDDTIVNTVHFPDGKSMDIKCCGCRNSASWTEAVLFNQNGCELVCTEVESEYDGPWELEYNGILYKAIVRAARSAHKTEDTEGVCPVCGGTIQYSGSNEIDDCGGIFPWTCPNCGTSGEEGYNRTFDRHYNVCDANGTPIPGRDFNEEDSTWSRT